MSGGINASVSGSRPTGPVGTQEAPPWLWQGNLTQILPELASRLLLRPRNCLPGGRLGLEEGVTERRSQSQASPGPCQDLTWGTRESLGLSPKSSAPASYLWMGVKTCRRHTKHQREVPGSEPGKGEPSSATMADTPTMPAWVLGPTADAAYPGWLPLLAAWGAGGLSPISSGERAAGAG